MSSVNTKSIQKKDTRAYLLSVWFIAVIIGILNVAYLLNFQRILAYLNNNPSVPVKLTLLVSFGIWIGMIIHSKLVQGYVDWLSPKVFFTLLFVVSSLGQPILRHLMGSLNIALLYNSRTLLLQMIMVLIGLAGWVIGVMLAEIRVRSNKTSNNGNSSFNKCLNEKQLFILRRISYLVLLLALVSAVVTFLFAIQSGLQYGENQFDSGLIYYIQLIGVIFFPPGLILASYANARLTNTIFSSTTLLSFLAFALLNALSGDRGVVLIAAFSLALSYHTFVKPLNFKQLASASLGFMFFSYIVLLYRDSAWSISSIWRIFFRPDLFARAAGVLLRDIGAPSMVNSFLVEWYPEIYSFYYGKTYVAAVLSLIPGFIFGGKLERPFIWPSLQFKSIYEGDQFLPNTAYGFSMVGEGYINFGFVGVFFLLLFVGLLLNGLYKRNRKSNSWWLVPLYVIVYSSFPFNLRADAVSLLKSLFYGIILLMFCIYLVQFYRRNTTDAI